MPAAPTGPGLNRRVSQYLEREVEPARLERARQNFLRRGFAKLPYLASAEIKQQVADEVEALIAEHGVRRDLTLPETGHTPRRMRNVHRAEIAAHGSIVPEIYAHPAVLRALETVAGEQVLVCPYQPEQFVITELEQSGDTHGWHWDDYSFALVWVIDCPPLEQGGFVQCVAHTQWNKDDPQLHRQFVSHPIHSLELSPGDLYFMRTDTTLHRVYPISGGRRLILNMAYAAEHDLSKPISHEGMETLWAETAR
ncbi:HalD/BesD family halogenase [Streptomyces capitiformicae]|uniref:Fe2OG dioxygenase domain-containing protein n=1 Tax=Streptomyces capitiformicae TaxID=2014920 RepID=A0A918Z3J1_9ACTN|nr:hypothetical protein [Streptomyces capitiformicae]GHE34744.1 hypothetical protein GCM10017771_52510 [Streptomyces capitiformicae]